MVRLDENNMTVVDTGAGTALPLAATNATWIVPFWFKARLSGSKDIDSERVLRLLGCVDEGDSTLIALVPDVIPETVAVIPVSPTAIAV